MISEQLATPVEQLATPPSFSQLRAKLLMYEQRLLLDDPPQSHDSPDTTMALINQLQSTTISHEANAVVHKNNTSASHSHPNSSKSSQSSRFNSNFSRTKCQICQKHGHSAARCRYRYSQSKNSGSNSPYAGYHYQQAPMFSTSPPPGSIQSWIPDSGASSHMTSDPSLLQHIQPYNGTDWVVVGDGPPYRDSPSHGPR